MRLLVFLPESPRERKQYCVLQLMTSSFDQRSNLDADLKYRECIAEICTKLGNINFVINGSCYRREFTYFVRSTFLQQIVLNVNISRHLKCYGLAFTDFHWYTIS